MNKHDIYSVVSSVSGVPLGDTGKVVEALLGFIRSEVLAGRSVVFTGFGTFRYNEFKARRGVNPSTHERIVIPSGARVSFKPGLTFAREVKKAYAKFHEHDEKVPFVEEKTDNPGKKRHRNGKPSVKLNKKTKKK